MNSLVLAALAAPLFYNIAPFSPGKEAEVAKDMVEYAARTGNDFVLYSLSFHAEGRPALAKTDRLIASYRALKRELAGTNVRLGILLQSVLGHWAPIGDDQEPWQRTVTLRSPGIRFCPLDPGHRAFLRETIRRAAAERPAMMMTDDDITGFKHSAECFCPLHLAELERRTGRRFSCDELRKIITDRSDAATVAAFEKLQEDTVIDVARLVREAIDSVDPAIPCCACMPGGEPWRAGRTAQAVAAKGQTPILRTCNGQYSEFLGDNFADRILETQYFIDMWKKDVPCLLDESDTFPHNLWSKSARSFHAKLAVGFFCGLKGAKLWLVNAHRGGLPVARNYTDILADHRGYYAAIAAAVDGATELGVRVPICADKARREWRTEYPNGWVREAFALYGVPFRAESDLSKDGVWALAGATAVDRLSEAELRTLLSHRVLVDGLAAEALTKRGLDSLIGARATRRDLVFHGEEMDGVWLKLTPSDRPPILEPLPGARALSVLVRKDAAKGTQETVAPGATLFENALGGRIAVTAWNPEVGIFNRRSEHRQVWIGRILDGLTGRAFPVRSADRQNTLALAVRAADGRLLVHVVNLCYDPLPDISLAVAKPVREAERLDAHGVWRPLTVSMSPGGVLRLPVALGMMEECVLRLAD